MPGTTAREQFTDAERAVARIAKDAVQAWERLTGRTLAPDGFELEWAV